MGTAFMVICSWLYIPLPVPITMQTFALCLLSALLGMSGGLWVYVCYVALGAVGLPVFSGFIGGFGALFGATGGYIVGFVFIPICVGLGTKYFGVSRWRLVLSMSVGLLFCYIFGTLWYTLMYTEAKGFWYAVRLCVLPYLIPDGLKILLAVILAGRLRSVLGK